MFKKLLYINLFTITILSLFNYIVFHNMNSEAYLESFKAYNQKITNMAFQNINQQVMEAGMEIPKLYFSDIAQNEDILRPQEEAILGSPVRIRELVNRLERLRKTHRYIKSLDIFYEGTGTVVTGFTAVHQIDTETEIRKYLPWYDTFAASGEETLFLENTQGIYPTNEAVITFVKKIALPKWKGRGIILAIHISLDAFQNLIDEENGTLILADPFRKDYVCIPKCKSAGIRKGSVRSEGTKRRRPAGSITGAYYFRRGCYGIFLFLTFNRNEVCLLHSGQYLLCGL